MNWTKLIRSLALLGLQVSATDASVVDSSPKPLTLGLYSTPEVQQRISLDIVGKIPYWVKGSLYRGAASSWDSGNYTAEHWFDGFSRNHRFEISEGKVEYRNRNATDELQDFVEETGVMPSGTFGGDPCKVIFGALENKFRDGNNPVGDKSTHSVPVSYIANFPGLSKNMSTGHGPFVTLVSTTDGNDLQQFDPVTLEPIELFNYRASNPAIISNGMCAAHPAHNPSGEIYNYVLDLSTHPPEYRVFVIETTGVGRILTTITDAPAAYLHAVFSTKNYLILVVWQADIGATKKPTYNILDTLKPWDPKRETIFYVIDKVKGGVTAKYTTETFFAFHEINSFEDPKTGSIIIDIPVQPDYSFLEASRLANLRANIGRLNASAKHDIPSTFRRYRLPDYANATRTVNGTIVPRRAILNFEIDYKTGNIELPRINQAYHGKAYQFAYGVHIEKPGYFTDSLIKIDTKTQKTKVWSPSTNHLPSEPIFVAHPNATSEDDGVILTVALDAGRKMSSLVVIDAKCMEEVARAELPLVVGYGFHGVWGGY